MVELIRFKATVSRVATDAAGGAKVTLCVPEVFLVDAAKLMQMQVMVLDVEIRPEINDPPESK